MDHGRQPHSLHGRNRPVGKHQRGPRLSNTAFRVLGALTPGILAVCLRPRGLISNPRVGRGLARRVLDVTLRFRGRVGTARPPVNREAIVGFFGA